MCTHALCCTEIGVEMWVHLKRDSGAKDIAVSTPYRLKYMVPPFEIV